MSINFNLDCLGQAETRILLELVVTNNGPRRILMPRPGITGLQFTDAIGINEQWYTRLFVSSNWMGLLLNPEESSSSTFSVTPASLARTQEKDNSDCHRWSIDITTGRYSVKYLMVVGSDYFDGNSHYRLPDVQREARQFAADAWTGIAESNIISVDYIDNPSKGGSA